MAEGTTKHCPFCAETIQAAAIVCRYCGRDLAEKAPAPVEQWTCPTCGRAQYRERSRGCAFCSAKPSRNPIGIVIITLVVLGALGWFLGLFGGSAVPRSPSAPVKSTYAITYRVGGRTTSASLTYQNAQGGTEQKKVQVPWASTFNARSGAFLYLSAQNQQDTGTISCEILVDNVVVKTSTSEGAYTIASCSGRL